MRALISLLPRVSKWHLSVLMCVVLVVAMFHRLDTRKNRLSNNKLHTNKKPIKETNSFNQSSVTLKNIKFHDIKSGINYQNMWHETSVDKDKFTLLFSAIIDERMQHKNKLVKVIAFTKDIHDIFYCSFLMKNASALTVNAEKDLLAAGPGFDLDDYSGMILTCPLPLESLHIPISLSITSKIKQHIKCFLTISEPRPRMNELYTRSSNRKYFVVGVCIFMHSPVGYERLIEWMELLKIFQVREVTLYASMLPDDDLTLQTLKNYIEQGFLVVIIVTIPDGFEEDHELFADPYHNDCIHRNRLRYSHLLFLTMNEMLYPRSHMETYTDVIQHFENKHKNRVGEFVLQTVNFFNELPRVSTEDIFLSQSFKYRARVDTRNNTKVGVMQPEICTLVVSRRCAKFIDIHHDNTLKVNVPVNIAEIASYKTCADDLELNCTKEMEVLYLDRIPAASFSKRFVEIATAELMKLMSAYEKKGNMTENTSLMKDPEELFTKEELAKLRWNPWQGNTLNTPSQMKQNF